MLIGPLTWFPSLAFAEITTFVYFIWIISEIVYQLIHRWPRAVKETPDRGSYWVIVITIFVSMTLAFLVRYRRLGTFTNDFQYLGLVLMVAGIIFRGWAILTLGKFFSVWVQIRADHQLVTSGPYHWLRHPSYTGALLTLVGFPLAIGTWVGALIVLIFALSAFSYRVRVEEQALLAGLGDSYREYMRRTWRFFPGL